MATVLPSNRSVSLATPERPLEKGAHDPQVSVAHRYLWSLGYVRRTAQDPEVFDDELESALRSYQAFFGLDETGALDAETLESMARPRCGVPDLIAGAERAAVVAWPSPDLQYTFLNFSPDLERAETASVIASALARWSSASRVRFQHVQSPIEFANPVILASFAAQVGRLFQRMGIEISIGFFRGDHGDADAFTDQTLGHGFFPPPVGDRFAGDVHFNEARRWSNLDFFLGVAIHELGHAIGLGHSSSEASVMHPVFQGLTELSAEDVQVVQSLYGAP